LPFVSSIGNEEEKKQGGFLSRVSANTNQTSGKSSSSGSGFSKAASYINSKKGNIFTTPETEENYNGLNIEENNPFSLWVEDAKDPDTESRDAKLDARFAGLSNPGSSMYDPYRTATNVHLQELSDLTGTDLTGGVSHEQIEQWYNALAADPSLKRTAGTATNPPGFSSPGTTFTKKKATQDEKNRWAYERSAYLVGELYQNERNTMQAEKELSDLQNQIKYWVGRTDLNLSDEQILKNIGLETDATDGKILKNYNKL
jgi:hypothetical protein